MSLHLSVKKKKKTSHNCPKSQFTIHWRVRWVIECQGSEVVNEGLILDTVRVSLEQTNCRATYQDVVIANEPQAPIDFT